MSDAHDDLTVAYLYGYSKGKRISDAYAKTIEANKDEISWYKRKLNTLATKMGVRTPVYTRGDT